MDAIGIGRSGLQASMLRLTASASNIANVQSSGTVPGGTPGGAPEDAQRAYQPVRAQTSPVAGGGVQASFVPVDPAYRLTYDPASPQANADGMIASPNVDLTDEMVEQIAAKLAFMANLKVIATASELEQRTVHLWG